MWFRLFATALVPLAALTYFNAKILIYYRDNNFTRAHTVMRRMRCNNESDQNRPQEIRLQLQNTRMTNGQIGQNGLNGQIGIEGQNQNGCHNGEQPHNRIPSYKTSRERTLFIMLCCITLTFFFCHLPR